MFLFFIYSFGQLVLTSYFVLHRYGLGGAVISNDLERCDRVSKVRLDLYLNEQRNHWVPK